MLTSKDILERTGISRATLNNYIASGLLPRPDVLPPGPDDGAAPRIGYFPDDTLERIATIQRLKRQGWSIARIAQHLSGKRLPAEDGEGSKEIDTGEAAQQPGAPSTGTVTARIGAPASFEPSGSRSSSPGALPGVPPNASAAAGTSAAAAAAAVHGSAMMPAAAAPPVREALDSVAGSRETGRASRGGPVLRSVAVLLATLQDAPGLWIRLQAQEYFELVDEIWTQFEAIFRAHGGSLGRHPDEGMTGCFLARDDGGHLLDALAAAHEGADAMQRLSLRWQLRKGWDVHLYMNTGLDAGDGWVGELGAGEMRVLGEPVQRAERLSRLAAAGMVLATRDMLGRLQPAQRQRVTFGVPRVADDPSSHVLFTFARLAELGLHAPVPPGAADLAVARILDVRAAADGPEPPDFQQSK